MLKDAMSKQILALTLCGINAFEIRGSFGYEMIGVDPIELKSPDKRSLIVAYGNINVRSGELEIQRRGGVIEKHFSCPFCDRTISMRTTAKYPLRKMVHDQACPYIAAYNYPPKKA